MDRQQRRPAVSCELLWRSSCAPPLRLGSRIVKHCERTLATCSIHIAVGDEADGVKGGILRPNALALEFAAQLHSRPSRFRAIENDDVRASFPGIDVKSGDLCDAFGQETRVDVIFV